MDQISTRLKLLVAVISVIVLLMAGTFIFNAIEGWTYIDSFYFTGITITTIGYGDFAPTHDISKIITVVFSFFGVGIVFSFLFITFGHYLSEKEKRMATVVAKHIKGKNRKSVEKIREEILEGT
ncbi:potassium channel family protein [Candidatus Aenigmatarchaeota archaeon]